MSEQKFGYAPLPEGYQSLFVEQINCVAFQPDGRQALIFFDSTMGQRVCLAVPLDAITAAISQIYADPATKLRVVTGGKV